MPHAQSEAGDRGSQDPDEAEGLERQRHRDDVVVIVGSLLAVFAVLGGAAFAAWSLSTDNELVATTHPQSDTPAY